MQPPYVSRSMALVCLAFVFSTSCLATLSAHRGPVPPPTDQWGAPGPYQVVTETVPSPAWPAQKVTVFKPKDAMGRRPIWFFGHGFGGTDPKIYAELLKHLASHGSFVVFSPYPVSTGNAPDAAYEIMYSGFKAAAARYASEIDLSRVGFAGHSYGGGAVPALALRGWREGGWGRNALALYIMAPWFSFFASDADLKALPAHSQAVIQVYAADTINDHRMAVDLFEHLPLPFAQKNFITLMSDRIEELGAWG